MKQIFSIASLIIQIAALYNSERLSFHHQQFPKYPLNKKQPDIMLAITIGQFIIVIYHGNDPTWWLRFGIPVIPLENFRAFWITINLLIFMGFFTRLFILLIEKNKLEFPDIFYALKHVNMAHLAHEYYLKMFIQVQMIANLVMKIFYSAQMFLIIFSLSVVVYCFY